MLHTQAPSARWRKMSRPYPNSKRRCGARAADRTYLIAILTDAARTTEEGGWWWEVVVPEVSQRKKVQQARVQYENDKRQQRR